MNENINLIELLKDCPKGTKFYSPICGVLEFSKIIEEDEFPIKLKINEMHYYSFTKEGYYLAIGTECLLFPSREQQDWEIWKNEQAEKATFKPGDYAIDKDIDIIKISDILDSETAVVKLLDRDVNDYQEQISNLTMLDKYPISHFRPFDRVLIRDTQYANWTATIFSHIGNNEEYPYKTSYTNAKQCIPYNIETEHLVGTCLDCPEFYKNW